MKEIGILFAKSLTRQPSREEIAVRLQCFTCLFNVATFDPIAINFEGPWTRWKE